MSDICQHYFSIFLYFLLKYLFFKFLHHFSILFSYLCHNFQVFYYFSAFLCFQHTSPAYCGSFTYFSQFLPLPPTNRWAFFPLFSFVALSTYRPLGIFLAFLNFHPCHLLTVGHFSHFPRFFPLPPTNRWAFFSLFSIFALAIYKPLGVFLTFFNFRPHHQQTVRRFSHFSQFSPDNQQKSGKQTHLILVRSFPAYLSSFQPIQAISFQLSYFPIYYQQYPQKYCKSV